MPGTGRRMPGPENQRLTPTFLGLAGFMEVEDVEGLAPPSHVTPMGFVTINPSVWPRPHRTVWLFVTWRPNHVPFETGDAASKNDPSLWCLNSLWISMNLCFFSSTFLDRCMDFPWLSYGTLNFLPKSSRHLLPGDWSDSSSLGHPRAPGFWASVFFRANDGSEFNMQGLQGIRVLDPYPTWGSRKVRFPWNSRISEDEQWRTLGLFLSMSPSSKRRRKTSHLKS